MCDKSVNMHSGVFTINRLSFSQTSRTFRQRWHLFLFIGTEESEQSELTGYVFVTCQCRRCKSPLRPAVRDVRLSGASGRGGRKRRSRQRADSWYE